MSRDDDLPPPSGDAEGDETNGDDGNSAPPEAQERIGLAFRHVVDALEADPDELEELSERLFGSRPELGLEEAAIDHAKRSREARPESAGAAGIVDGRMVETPGDGGKLEEFVRLSFRGARNDTSTAENEHLRRLEQELGGEGGDGFVEEPVPEVDAREFILEWRRNNPGDAAAAPSQSVSGELMIDPLAESVDDGPEDAS